MITNHAQNNIQAPVFENIFRDYEYVPAFYIILSLMFKLFP